MEPLATRDQDRLHDLIGRIYTLALGSEGRAETLDEIAAVCGGVGLSVFSFTGYSLSNPPAKIGYNSASIGESVEFYARNVILERNIACPRISAINRRRLSDGVFTDASLIGADRLDGDPLISHLTAAFKVGYAATRLSSELQDGTVFAISVLRDAKAGMPHPDEMRLFDLLSGHLLRSLQMVSGLNRQPDTIARTMMEKCDLGVIVLDSGGRVRTANQAADKMDGDGLAIINRQLFCTHRPTQTKLDRHLATALSNALHHEDAKPVALPRRLGRKSLILQAIPLLSSQGEVLDRLLSGNGALVTVVDPDHDPATNRHHIFLQLGLTPAEARVADLLVSGASPQAVAETLELSTGTVRNHLKNIFAKLDIARQSELVALAGRFAGL
ncbi:MAG: hypothetical protein RLZZ444_1273 [Pseudomonadota bacterium]|jgi:DNA-binding CsgD family transcriptional regulator